MNVKKDDLKNITRNKLIDKAEGANIDSLFGYDIGLKNVPIKVSVIYALIGGSWILFSDGILNKLIESRALMAHMQTIKGWVYVLTSSLILYFLISEYAKKSKAWSNRLKENYEEIQGTYGQLIAAEEELRAQYDELHEKQEIIEKSEERYKLALEGANDAIWEIF